VMQIQNHPF
jgi:hypothetical protein